MTKNHRDMQLQSMTGFARSEGTEGSLRWIWELRSVNGRSLDIRVRLPSGYEKLEPAIRKALSDAFQRGSIQVSLVMQRDESPARPVINQAAFDAVLHLVEQLSKRVEAAPPTIDGLLNIRGVLDLREPDLDPTTLEHEEAVVLQGLQAAIVDLTDMRATEGAKIGALLSEQIDAVETLVGEIERDPSRQPEAIVNRLADHVRLLLKTETGLDEDRLHAEAVILATKADLREEIDRLAAHIDAARTLLGGGVVGRRLDFLAQEFNRETNTICSKSNAAAVTAKGLELKVLIDRFREQLQNLE